MESDFDRNDIELDTAPLLPGQKKTQKENAKVQRRLSTETIARLLSELGLKESDLQLSEEVKSKLDNQQKDPNYLAKLAAIEANRQTNKKRRRTFLAFNAFSIPEALNFSIIFFMNFSKTFLNVLLSPPMRFISFPIAAICGLVKASLLWHNFHLTRKAYKDKRATKEERNISFLQAAWETLNGLGTTGAVVTGIVGFFIGASVGMGISITFNFFLATSTAFCAAFSAYYGITAYRAYKEWKKASPEGDKNHKKYDEYVTRKHKAKTNAFIAGFVALLTVGVILAMVVGLPFSGPIIGIAGCLIAAGFAAYHLYKTYKNKEKKISPEMEALLSQDSKILLDEMPVNRSDIVITEKMRLTKSCNDLHDSLVLKNQILSPEEKAATKQQLDEKEPRFNKELPKYPMDLTSVKSATFNKFKHQASSTHSSQEEGLRKRKPFVLAQ